MRESRLSRQRKITLYTHNAVTAVQALSIRNFLNIPVSALLLNENISTRFLLHNMDPQVSCKDITEELEYSGVVFCIHVFLQSVVLLSRSVMLSLGFGLLYKISPCSVSAAGSLG